jgi:hypothetical protein
MAKSSIPKLPGSVGVRWLLEFLLAAAGQWTMSEYFPSFLPVVWFVILVLITLELLNAAFMRKTAIRLYSQLGVKHTVLSYIIVSVLGATLFGVYWFGVSRAFRVLEARKATPSKTAAPSATPLSGPRFKQRFTEVTFQLGAHGFSFTRPAKGLMETPVHVVMFEQYPVVDMYVGPDDGQLYANVIQWDANAQPRYLLQNNEVVIDNPALDLNYNDQALEIVSSENRPIFQFIYKTEAHIIVRGIFTVPGGFLVIDDTGTLPHRIREIPKDVAIPRIFKYPSWQHKGEYEVVAPSSSPVTQAAPVPSFKVTVPVTSRPGLVRLDVNVLRTSRPDEKDGNFFPVLAEFENLPSGDGNFSEVKDVWAQVIYRDFDFLGVELARSTSGCWLDQPVADVLFPLRTPRYLVLGGWHTEKEGSPNEFRIFEYSREFHRATEKEVKIMGPRKILIEQRRLVIDVVLTSNGHHGSSSAYQFQLGISGPCGYSINCVRRPSLS